MSSAPAKILAALRNSSPRSRTAPATAPATKATASATSSSGGGSRVMPRKLTVKRRRRLDSASAADEVALAPDDLSDPVPGKTGCDIASAPDGLSVPAPSETDCDIALAPDGLSAVPGEAGCDISLAPDGSVPAIVTAHPIRWGRVTESPDGGRRLRSKANPSRDLIPAPGETGCDIASAPHGSSVPVLKRRRSSRSAPHGSSVPVLKRRCSSRSAPHGSSVPVLKRRRFSRSVRKQNDESDDDDDGKHIKLRWSTARVFRFLQTLRPNQKKIVAKYGFGYIFDIKSFTVPIGLTEWVISNVSSSSREFILNQKCIRFKKDMVTKVLGMRSGNKPVEVDTTDSDIEALVEKFKSEYRVGHTYPIKKCMELMLKEDDEVKFMRHFMLFLISTIFMPGKSNCLCVEYLYSLVDLTKLHEFDWAEEVLRVIMHEVRRFHTLSDSLGRDITMKHFYMEGCLPLLAIVYSDFLDLPQGSPNVHSLNYSVPRICNLSSRDFDFIMEIDRNKSAHPHVYGIHPFRDISCTPYYSSAPLQSGIPQTVLHPDVKLLVDKHRLLWKADLSFLAKTFNDVLENRVQSFVADVNILYTPSNGVTAAGPSGSPAHPVHSSSPSDSFPSNPGQPSSDGLPVSEGNDIGNQDGVNESSLPVL